MSTGNFELLTQIQEFVTDHFRQKVDAAFVFHNLLHTQEVVAACEEMADYYNLSEDDRFALSAAAWFHDSGFAHGTAMGHEAKSIRLATEFLQHHKEYLPPVLLVFAEDESLLCRLLLFE